MNKAPIDEQLEASIRLGIEEIERDSIRASSLDIGAARA